ncbi:MAG: DUF3482 domain-containing protein [Burkholderiales bacterium]|nr:DUF3482 domain-containing protein [Burkholderiales bacterium]
MPQTIALSLVSHTNVGKTTLARTLLGRDVGEVRDEAHVTLTADMHEMAATPGGERLVLWDTPGFGDSTRLARRLAQSRNPIGWFLAQVWDRYRDRAFWSSQQAAGNVREQADVVLYLVNASEDPADAGYVDPEMQVLEWIGKPVVVLLNQLGRPRPAAEEQADVQRWRAHLAGVRCVRAVLAFDAFARCWVQEAVLFDALAEVLASDKRDAFVRLSAQWLRRRRETFDASLVVLSERLARAALDREPVDEGGWTDRLRGLGIALGLRREAGDSPRALAMRALAERLDADIRVSSDRLIALHGLGGHASAEILTRLAKHYALRERLSEGKAAALGGMVTGALAGLKADLASGGLTFGAGLLVGGVLGALGGAGLARGYNLVRGAEVTTLAWTEEVLDELAVSALLGYLAVAHYGRGRGDWAASEYPAHWQETVAAAFARCKEAFDHAWSLRGDADASETMEPALREALAAAARDVLQRLYPDARVDYGDGADLAA